MFVGYEIKNNQNQAKPVVLEKDIVLSQAVLDPSSVKNKNKEPVCLVAEHNKKQFIIAVLDPTQSWQCSLNLMFSAGSQLKFFIRGSGSVHLTGFESQDLDDDIDMSDSEDSEEGLSLNGFGQLKAPTGSDKKTPQTNGSKGSPKKMSAKKPAKSGHQESSSDDSDDEDYLNFDDNDSDSDAEMYDVDDDDDDDLGELDEEDDDDDDEEEEDESSDDEA